MIIRVEFLREIMKIQKKTIVQLAKDCNMSESTLKKLLNGESEDPRISTLYIVASALGASIDRLVGLAPPRDFHEENRAYDANLMETMQDRVKMLEAQVAARDATIETQRQRIHDLDVCASACEAKLEAKTASIKHRDEIISNQAAALKKQQHTLVCCAAALLVLTCIVGYGVWEIINIDKGVTSLILSGQK